MQKNDLEKYFNPYGNIVDIQIIYNNKNNSNDNAEDDKKNNNKSSSSSLTS